MKCGGVKDRDFLDYKYDIDLLDTLSMPVLDEKIRIDIENKIVETRKNGDSVGGIIDSVVIGLPPGIGEPWFDGIEGMLSRALFAIPAVKGIEFGAGFNFANMKGSVANDCFRSKNNKVYTETNNNGGINGGITNGMPITFKTVVKPTPSICKEQKTINIGTNENKNIVIKGRHDPAIVHRAAVVIDSITSIVICDILAIRFGTDFLRG